MSQTLLMMRTTTLPPPGRYRLDPERCVADLAVRHLAVLTARGSVAAIEGELVVDERDPLASSVRVDLDAASLTTGNPERDAVIQGADFLAVSEFPLLRFESTSIGELGDGHFEVAGDLYVRDIVGPLVLQARLVAITPSRIAFSAVGEISRATFGLTWSAGIERAGVVVADEVKLVLGAEFVA